MRIVQNPSYTSDEELEEHIGRIDESMNNLLDSIGLDDETEGRIYNNLKKLADKTREIKNDELKLAYDVFGKEAAYAEELLDELSEEHGEKVKDRLRTYFETGELPDVDLSEYSGERLLGELDENYESKSPEDKMDELSLGIAHLYDRLENMDEELMKGIVEKMPEREQLIEDAKEVDTEYGWRSNVERAYTGVKSLTAGISSMLKSFYYKDEGNPIDPIFNFGQMPMGVAEVQVNE